MVGVDINLLKEEELKNVKILENEGKIKIENSKVFNLDYLLSDELALFIYE